MSFSANDHPNPGPEDPLYYAPRAKRMADPRSGAAPQTRPERLPSTPPLSRFDEMREEAFARSMRPLESQFAYEPRRSRGWLATVGAIAAAVGVSLILALVLVKGLAGSKSDPAELAVSISTPALATPVPPATSDDSQALLQKFKHYQGSDSPEPAASDPASVGTVKEGPEKSQVLLDKFMQWQQRK
jgi:hypothetical protein